MQASLTSSELAQRRAGEGAQRGEQRCRAGRTSAVASGLLGQAEREWCEAGKEPPGLSNWNSNLIRSAYRARGGSAEPYLYICGGPPQGLLKPRVVAWTMRCPARLKKASLLAGLVYVAAGVSLSVQRMEPLVRHKQDTTRHDTHKHTHTLERRLVDRWPNLLALT